MIAKRILRGKAGKFSRLGDYIARQRGVAANALGTLALLGGSSVSEEVIWQRTADYIIDAVGVSRLFASPIAMQLRSTWRSPRSRRRKC